MKLLTHQALRLLILSKLIKVGLDILIARYLTISHHISPYLTISHYISPYLTISYYISPYLTIYHHILLTHSLGKEKINLHRKKTFFGTFFRSLTSNRRTLQIKVVSNFSDQLSWLNNTKESCSFTLIGRMHPLPDISTIYYLGLQTTIQYQALFNAQCSF